MGVLLSICGGGVLGVLSAGRGQRLVYRRLKAADVFDGGAVCLHSLHVLVEDGEDLIVEDLVLPDAVRHLLQRLGTKRGSKAPFRSQLQIGIDKIVLQRKCNRAVLFSLYKKKNTYFGHSQLSI